MKCPILMAYALTSKNYFGNLFQWRNAILPRPSQELRETVNKLWHRVRPVPSIRLMLCLSRPRPRQCLDAGYDIEQFLVDLALPQAVESLL